MKIVKTSLFACSVLCAFFLSVSAQWIKQTVNTTASLRGLSVVDEKVIWASGTSGTVIRTIDGGKTWQVMTVPGAEKLDFRDIEAFDQFTAYVLSIGNGESSRIYKTTDGGKTWNLQFKNTNERAFFDAIACWDKSSCIAMSDPVDGHYLLIFTSDGGGKWTPFKGNKPPAAKDGEAAFAASGTCLITDQRPNFFLVTGGQSARVLRGLQPIDNYGELAWLSSDTPIVRGTAGSGIFSIAMFDLKNGVIVGGNYEKPNEAKDNMAFTKDAGVTWTLGTGLSGYRSGVTYVDKKTIIAVGTNGSDVSSDGGKTWSRLDKENYNSVQAFNSQSVWAVGAKGLVSTFHFRKDVYTKPLK